MKLPPGLVHALQGIADRLEKAQVTGREKGATNAAVLTALDRDHFVEVFTAQWTADSCTAAAREIRIALEVWQKPPPRTRRGRR